MLGVDLPQTQVFSPLRQQVEAVMIAVGLVSSVLRLRVFFEVVCEVAVVVGMKLCCECAVVIEGERSDAKDAFYIIHAASFRQRSNTTQRRSSPGRPH